MTIHTRIRLGGHRGLGCTDHDFFQDKRDIAHLPCENTLESLAAAYKAGAGYIETDVLMSADGILFCLHNVVPKDHFFGDNIPPELLNKMSFRDIQNYHTGRNQNGHVMSFADMLKLVAQHDPQTLPWAVNIEIKDLQGSGQPYADNDFIARIAEAVDASPLAIERILWSGFSLTNVIKASHHFPTSSFAMLFRERKDGDETTPPAIPIFTDHVDDPLYQYLPFNSNSLDMVSRTWQDQAHPAARLGYMHPEIMTVNDTMIADAATRGFGLNTWGLFEVLDAPRQNVYKHVVQQCAKHNVPLTLMTDYLPEMQALDLKLSN